MRFFRVLLVLALLPVCMAQMCGTAAPVSTPDQYGPERLEVTQELRDACPMNTDAELRMYLSNMENRRLNGMTRQDEVNMNYAACDSTACMTCWSAITYQIHPLN